MSMQMITDVTIDLYGEVQYYMASAKQGDKATRYLRVQLMNNGNEYQIPDDIILIANIKKPDGKFCYNQCEKENNRVMVQLTSQALAAAGTAYCDIEMRDNDDNLILSSAAFSIEIEKSMRDENAIESCNEITFLEKKIQRYIDSMLEVKAQVLSTEEAFKIAETARVLAENIRVDAENIREENELKRIEAEKTRQQQLLKIQGAAEAATTAANRATAAAETSEKTEEAVNKAEEARVLAENIRVDAENIRKENELKRIEAEKIRQEHPNDEVMHITSKEREKWNNAYTHTESKHVTGVKGNSEVDYRTGNIDITPENIGLGKVDNTADTEKTVAYAHRLKRWKTISPMTTLNRRCKIATMTLNGSWKEAHFMIAFSEHESNAGSAIFVWDIAVKQDMSVVEANRIEYLILYGAIAAHKDMFYTEAIASSKGTTFNLWCEPKENYYTFDFTVINESGNTGDYSATFYNNPEYISTGTALTGAVAYPTYEVPDHTHSNYYDSDTTRTANTVLAAPNKSNGGASFRKLTANDLPMDSTLSTSSENPVQNKVIKNELDKKASSDHSHSYAGSNSAGGAAIGFDNGSISIKSNGINSTSGLHLIAASNNHHVYTKGKGVYSVTLENTPAPVFGSTFSTQSSRRYKENIVDMSANDAIKLLQVDVKRFDYIRGAKDVAGCIAEDVENIFPDICTYDIEKEGDTEEKLIGLDYSKFVPYLIKMVQIQQEEINQLKSIRKDK